MTRAYDNAVDARYPSGRRNLIINGAMQVNQRNQTVTTSDAFYVDRFKAFYNTSSGRYSIVRDSDAPDNFEYSSKVTITATDDLTGSEHMTLAYYAEGYDVAHLNFGTSAAREFTLSFWVKSSIAGTYGVSFRNHAANRSFVSSYTINSADTWEHKSVTVTADANGSWTKTNGIGLVINWELGNSANYSTSPGSWQSGNYWGLTGGTKLVNTNGATFQFTGVQLEAGNVATPFEHRSYGEELALCQRYYQTSYADGTAAGTITDTNRQLFWNMGTDTYVQTQVYFSTRMRSQPTTVLYSNATGASGKVRSSGADKSAATQENSQNMFQLYVVDSVNDTANINYHWTAEAEL